MLFFHMRYSDFHFTTKTHHPSLLNTLMCSLHILSATVRWRYYTALPKASTGLFCEFPPLCPSFSKDMTDSCLVRLQRENAEEVTSMHFCYRDTVIHKDHLYAPARKKLQGFSLKVHFSLPGSGLEF